jgi:glycosyltransferase involved in cell wall biosynthesis
MRIFCFGSDYPPTGGGISTHTREWLLALAEEKGIKVRATIFGNKAPRVGKIWGVIEITILKPVGFFYVGWRIFKDMWKYKHYDVFHSFNLFPVGFWTVFWAKVFGKKSVLTFYGADACDKRTSAKVLWLQKWALKNATWCVTISEFTKNKVIERYTISDKNIHIIHPILPTFEKAEPENVRAKFGIVPDDFVVLSVSRLVKRKGIEYLIEAISKIKDPKVKLLIVGGGPEEKSLFELVTKLGLKDRVFFAGKVPVLAPYYEACDIAALVSYIIEEEGDFEGLGLVLLEAQSYKKPVIGSKSGGIPETFVDGVTGISVPERDPNAIKEAILDFKEVPDNYAFAKKEIPLFLEQEFGKGATVKKYLELISK